MDEHKPTYELFLDPPRRAAFDAICTLGENPLGGTCSIDAATFYGRSVGARCVYGFRSFEDAAVAVIASHGHSLFLVPTGYGSTSRFLFDSRLRKVDCFDRALPDICVAGPNGAEMDDECTVIFLHPALDAFLPGRRLVVGSYQHVSSNTAACTSVLTSSRPAVAITTTLAAEVTGLSVIRILRVRPLMPFLVFASLGMGVSTEAASPTAPALRAAIVVANTLEVGSVLNAAAIVMGQLALAVPGLYAPHPVHDETGLTYAAIRYSVVILRGRRGQLAKIAREASMDRDLACIGFPFIGQTLNNEFDEYVLQVKGGADLDLVAVGVAGEDNTVRALTRSCSLYS